jgi:GTP cyclohydrolase I
MSEKKLKEKLAEWITDYKDVVERNALAETPKESANYLVTLFKEYVKGCELTPEEVKEVWVKINPNLEKESLIVFKSDIKVSHATISKVMEGLE